MAARLIGAQSPKLKLASKNRKEIHHHVVNLKDSDL